MTRVLLILGFLFAIGASAHAQSQTYICIKTATGCQIVDSTHPIPTGPVTVTPTVAGGTLTLASGGAASTLSASTTTARSCLIQNPSTATGQGIATAETIWVNYVTTATAASGGSSFEVVSGGNITTPQTTLAVSWIAATTGHKIGAVCQ